MGKFDKTQAFSNRMRPCAHKLYKQIFKGCKIEELTKGKSVHILDKHFGVDSLIHLKNGAYITLQEKYRENCYLKFGDVTQEDKNAYKTRFESDGEWHKLAAQLYFNGCADKNESYFEKWVLLGILRYKIEVDLRGGLDQMGKLQFNKNHGAASFVGINLNKLGNCIILDSAHFNRFQNK